METLKLKAQVDLAFVDAGVHPNVVSLLAEVAAALNEMRNGDETEDVVSSIIDGASDLVDAAVELPADEVRSIVVMLAATVLRVVLDHDATINAWRKGSGLDPPIDASGITKNAEPQAQS